MGEGSWRKYVFFTTQYQTGNRRTPSKNFGRYGRSGDLGPKRHRLAHLRAEEESSLLLKNGEEYPIWSPYNAHEAAETLIEELDIHKMAEFEE